MNIVKTLYLTILALSPVVIGGCTATESSRTLEPPVVATYGTSYRGPRTTLVVANFDNRTSYMQGMFSADPNLLGNQAKSILKTHLQQTNRFTLVDRDNLSEIQQEAAIRGQEQQLKGARYALTGAVSEFGRKETGDAQLYGILGSGKQQTAYAKVALNVVDVDTSEIVYATQGAGEYALSSREIAGFGSRSGYDSTLNGKVLNLAITEVVNNLVRDIENGTFQAQQ